MKTKKSKIVWLSIIAVVVIIIIAASSGSDESKTTTTGNETSEAVAQEWVELISIKGSGEKKSQSFTISGDKVRMRYNFKADGDMGALFAAYVIENGVDIMKEGGIPEVMLSKSEESESNLSHLSKGEYYLNIMSANGDWEVIIEELK